MKRTTTAIALGLLLALGLSACHMPADDNPKNPSSSHMPSDVTRDNKGKRPGGG